MVAKNISSKTAEANHHWLDFVVISPVPKKYKVSPIPSLRELVRDSSRNRHELCNLHAVSWNLGWWIQCLSFPSKSHFDGPSTGSTIKLYWECCAEHVGAYLLRNSSRGCSMNFSILIYNSFSSNVFLINFFTGLCDGRFSPPRVPVLFLVVSLAPHLRWAQLQYCVEAVNLLVVCRRSCLF